MSSSQTSNKCTDCNGTGIVYIMDETAIGQTSGSSGMPCPSCSKQTSARPPNFRSIDTCISCKFIELFPPKGLEDHKYFSCKKYETAIINGRGVCDDFNSEDI